MPLDPLNEDLSEILNREYRNLNRDGLTRVITGKSLYASTPRPDPDYARLVLLRAIRIFCELSGLPGERFHLFEKELEVLNTVIEPQNPQHR